MSISSIYPKMNYVECEKGGLHSGEVANYVCMEKACRVKQNSIGCSVCMEQEHSTCRKSPLKYVYKQLQDIVESQKSESGESDEGGAQQQVQEILQSLIVSSRQQILESVLQSTNALISKAKNIQKLCVEIFDGIQAQTKQKISSQNQLEGILNEILFSSESVSRLQQVIDHLFSVVPEDTFMNTAIHEIHSSPFTSQAVPKNGAMINASTTTAATSVIAPTAATLTTNTSKEVSQNEYSRFDLKNLQENLLYLFKQISSTVSTKNDAILVQLNLQEKYLADLQNDHMLVHNLTRRKKLDLSFSATDKHPSINIIQPSTVKSNQGSSSNYKFALTNSNLPMNCPTKFAFKMKSINTQNWIAIGVALKKVIKSKSYSFGLALGHGAYMISSNSGSWSHSEQTNNNVVKSFDFSNGSMVECLFDPVEGFIHFQLKENNSKKYKLQIDKTKTEDDTYHPCVLFYYPNDEVELIYPYS